MDEERGWSLADYGDNGTKTPAITDHKEYNSYQKSLEQLLNKLITAVFIK